MAENEKGLLGQVFQSVNDRISGQVTGQFILAWILINWKIPINLIYGSDSASDRIAAIQAIYPSFWYALLNIALFPALCAITYLLFIPKIREWHFKYIQIFEARKTLTAIETGRSIDETSNYGQTLKVLFSKVKRDSDGDLRLIAQAEMNLRAVLPAVNPMQAETINNAIRSVTVLRGQVADRKALLERFSEPENEPMGLPPGWNRAVESRMKIYGLKAK